jgi:hypothetical protein
MAVKAHRGIPLGIAMEPTERQDIFRLLANHLIEQGFPRDHMARLPRLSDEETALNAYASQYHELHCYCYRHLLEALGSGTFAAMFARRLLFTSTEQQFVHLVDQTICDFDAGFREALITKASKKKFEHYWDSDHN